MAEIHAKKIDERKFPNLLQQDVVIKGEVIFCQNTLIKGKIQGALKSQSEIVIERHAQIHGNIQAASLQVHGSIIGDVHCSQQAHIQQEAQVTGDIHTPSLNIESGSFFEGRSIMNNKLQNENAAD